MMRSMPVARRVAFAVVLAVLGSAVLAQTESASEEFPYQESIDYDADGDVDQGDLARAAQNPVASMISLPLQNNFFFEVGPEEGTLWVLNVQPVIPVSAGKWNLINRPIFPLINTPAIAPGIGGESGLGDLNYQLFVSPAKPSKFIWGVGPALVFPTATEDILGSEKWSAGPAAVGLVMPGQFVVGFVAQQVWSYAGDDDRADVSEFLTQLFVNYNFSKGWYVTSAPIITANWEADSDQRWVVPIGGGVGKILKIGKQPVNMNLQIYYNLEAPDALGDWQGRFQFQFLFPKKPKSPA